MKREYFGERVAIVLATRLIQNSVPFEVEPHPWDVFCFTVKDESAHLMPKENVGRDALTETEDTDAPVLKCRYCGREHEIDGGLFEGDPCPSDDCPSHDMGCAP